MFKKKPRRGGQCNLLIHGAHPPGTLTGLPPPGTGPRSTPSSPPSPPRKLLSGRPSEHAQLGLGRDGVSGDGVPFFVFCVFCLSPGRPRNHPTEHTPGRRLHWGPRQTPQTPKNTPKNSKKHQKRHKTIRKTQSK